MQEFFLVIDTETSGLPKNWTAPYFKEKNWPHIVQIAWIIYDSSYQEIKRENHYIKNDGFKIDAGAEKIHKITNEYLQINGEPLSEVMDLFCDDIIKFKPLIIGHFIELDYHMVNVELSRLEKENIFQNSTFYCTMKTSADYVTNSVISHLKLNKFYTILFNEEPSQIHNALADASNTAKIFFHLITNKKITLTSVYKQEHSFNKAEGNIKKSFFKRIIERLFNGK
ncbi:exonuclease domain-containing protein [Pedobacter fastidiosus]|uniref:3'-5' exonuclease n=1 Tax=Pedobacter fastidiosus TaxID=2765361 RepID=A0ABR7KMP8_9SPHI|nr:3'-5' exonuclease [Pedobacter fastidiosus]MBC6109354.1 3'-5' exonuclease [Pedobacter fastidiosus]